MLISGIDRSFTFCGRLRNDAKPAMVFTANDLQEWKDFPKGLKVLLHERDNISAAEIRAKLEAMDYNVGKVGPIFLSYGGILQSHIALESLYVSTFCDENDALSVISSGLESFHIAIVEVSSSSAQGGFKFLENAKDLPTIIEFLSKPLSEDKLRNIWQHVVHKAFNAGANILSESLKPVKESVASMLQLQTDNEQHESRVSIDIEKVSSFVDNDHELSPGNDKYPAPSTPQLMQGTRLLDDGDCQEQANCSTEKESGEHDGESKSVETTCGNLNAEITPQQRKSEITLVREEVDIVDASMGESVASPHTQKRKVLSNTDRNTKASNKVGVHSDSCEIRGKRKKIKVDWTPELHKKFVKAVEQLGIDQAIPSRILELMKVESLTRHNVASHLQKYRMHKRQILPKEEERKWSNQRERSYSVQRPIMAFPPYHSNHTHPLPPVYPMWGQSGGPMAGMQIWGSPGYPLWQPTAENWRWKPFPGMHADAWGCPVLPIPPQAPGFPYSQNMPALLNADAADHTFTMPQSSFEHYLAEEVVDKVVKEAINKPWLPLPLGLKPPSTESVLAELSRQGISNIPPKGSKSC
ncbi:hypothetical protein JHK84_047498 [Glycine max]|nr:hypothetical protein JHK85_048064 [Glycine max]KAG5102529.1 hypothetical protein JHK84_047498 [Glycine max]